MNKAYHRIIMMYKVQMKNTQNKMTKIINKIIKIINKKIKTINKIIKKYSKELNHFPQNDQTNYKTFKNQK